MIPMPKDWVVVPEAEMIELVHPRGRSIGVVRYRERVRPLLRLGDLVRSYLALTPAFAGEIEKHERLTTNEGEHAALVTLTGTQGGAPAQHDLGFVFGDDYFASIWSRSSSPADFGDITSTVRELVLSDNHALGVRRRRYEYKAPDGWEPIVDGFVTDWYPPDFPKDSSILTMRPANPRKLEPLESVAAVVHELGLSSHTVTVVMDPAPLTTARALHGTSLVLRVQRGTTDVFKRIAVVQDARFTYSVELTMRVRDELAAHATMFAQTIDSITPIPEVRSAASHAQVLAHWTE